MAVEIISHYYLLY